MNAPISSFGHNQGPALETLPERLKEDYADLVAEAESAAFAATSLPAEIKTEKQNADATDAVKRINTTIKLATTSRETEKRPFLQAGREVDAFFGNVTNELADKKTAAEQKISAFLRAKADAERREREAEERKARAEREAAEAAAAEAARLAAAENAKAEDREAANDAHDKLVAAAVAEDEARRQAAARDADLARSRSASGSTSTLRTTWDFTITNLDAIPLDTLRPYLKRADIEKAIRAYVNAGRRDLAGVEIFETSKATIR